MAGRSWPSSLQDWGSREPRAGDVGMQIRKIIANVSRPCCAAGLTSRSRGFPSLPFCHLLRRCYVTHSAQLRAHQRHPFLQYCGEALAMVLTAALWGSPCRREHLLSGAPAVAQGHCPARPACMRSVPPLHQLQAATLLLIISFRRFVFWLFCSAALVRSWKAFSPHSSSSLLPKALLSLSHTFVHTAAGAEPACLGEASPVRLCCYI